MEMNGGIGSIAPAVPSNSSGSKLGAQFGWVSGGRLLGALVQASTLILVARWSGPVGFGAVGIALSLVVIFQTATDLGLPTYVLRERAASPNSVTIRRALHINNLTARCMAVLLVAVFALTLIGLTVQPLFVQLFPLAIWAATDRNTETWLGVTLADGDAKVNTIAILARRISGMLLMVIAYELGAAPLFALSISLAFIGLLTNHFAHRNVSRRLSPCKKEIDRWAILHSSRPYWITSIATQLGNLNAVVVGLIAGNGQVAFYAAASKVTGPLRILPTSMAVVLIPTTARVGVGRLRQIVAPVIIVLSAVTPTLSGLGAAILCRRGRPVGAMIQDLTDASAAESGTSSGRVGEFIAKVEYWLLKRTDRIGVITPRFGTILTANGIDEAKLVDLPNFTHVTPVSDSAPDARERLGWQEHFTVVHSGTMGMKQGLETVVEAAQLAEAQCLPVQFVLVGDGNQRRALEQLSDGCSSLRFVDPLNADSYPYALAAADVLLVNERRGVREMSRPSKLTSYTVAGRPIVAAVECDGITAETLSFHGAALLCQLGDPAAMLIAIRAIMNSADLGDRLVAGAEELNRNRYGAASAFERYGDFVALLVGSPSVNPVHANG